MRTGERLVGRYRLERLLGRGGMAEVHLAHDDELGRAVAVKLLTAAGDDAFRARFEREARVAAALAHPNVVRIFDAGEDADRRYIVMEYVDGESLAELLRRRGKLAPVEAVALALQACAGLEAAHAAGLVHRDVKPHNLLLGRDGTLKIADFGIARSLDATGLTEHGTLLGTAAYVAPEQFAGDEVTAAADVYSLAAVLYEALTGRTPYRFASLAELAHRQLEGRIVPLRDLEPDMPAALEQAVMRALARDPRYRPASAAAFGAELAASADESPTEPLPRRKAPVRRYENIPGRAAALWLGIALAAAAVASGIGVALSRTGDGEEAPATPAPVQPVPQGQTPADQARNLADWIRDYSR